MLPKKTELEDSIKKLNDALNAEEVKKQYFEPVVKIKQNAKPTLQVIEETKEQLVEALSQVQ